MVLIIVMGGNVIVFFHGGVSLLTGIAHSVLCWSVVNAVTV